MDCTALQKLQEIAQLCDASDRPSFDAYRTDQKPMLERKIRMIYCADTVPSIEQQGDATAIRFGTGEPKMETMVKNLVDAIWNQSKHSDGVLKMQVVYFALVDDLTIRDPEDTTNYILCPVFRTMKCVDPATRNSIGKCMIFVDEYGRVYQNWEKFKENNKYPKAAIVAPKKGWYRLTDEESLETEVFLTPACSLLSSLANTLDNITIGTGLMASGVLITSVFMPVAAPLVMTAVGALAVAATYSGVQSGMRLYDISAHEQSIGFDNPEAVGHWLSAAGGLAGVASGASAATLNRMAMARRTTTWATQIEEYFANNNPSVTTVLDARTRALIASVALFVDSPYVLDGVISRIQRALSRDGFNILFDISKVITEHFRREMFSFEDVLYDVYTVLNNYARRCGVDIERIIRNFNQTYESIPVVVRDYFQQIITRVGPTRCLQCHGNYFNAQ